MSIHSSHTFVRGEIVKCISHARSHAVTMGRLYVIRAYSTMMGPRVIDDNGHLAYIPERYFRSILKP
jgi:hypothetical protein